MPTHGYDWAAGYVAPFRAADGSTYTTPDAVVSILLDAIGEDREVVDLGSGDGRIALAAARRGLRARGIELDASLIAESRAAAEMEALSHLASFEENSVLDVTLPPEANLVTYLLPPAVKKLAQRLASSGHSGRLFVLRWTIDLPELIFVRQHALADGWVANEFRVPPPTASGVKGSAPSPSPTPPGVPPAPSSPPPAASLLVMTSPGRLPERLPLLRRCLHTLIHQEGVQPLRPQHSAPPPHHRPATSARHRGLEVLVLDDEPACAAWPVVHALRPAAAAAGVSLRYVALPADAATGKVNMRLKRNAALLLCTGTVAVFCDDDDWRSPSSVIAQLDALAFHDADVATWQVQNLCEVHPAEGAIRFFALADGSGVFSSRLGNPGTAALRREVWEANPQLGFPDTTCEDVDYMRLLTADSPLLTTTRPRKCKHVLVDLSELNRQRRHAGFMTVRVVGGHHEWPLEPLDLPASEEPPACLDPTDASFLRTHCDNLASSLHHPHAPPTNTQAAPYACDGCEHDGSEHTELVEPLFADVPQPMPPPPPPPLSLAAVLSEAAIRMETANRALALLSAYTQQSNSHPTPPAPVAVHTATPLVSAASSDVNVVVRTLVQSARSLKHRITDDADAGAAAMGAAADAMGTAKELSAMHRAASSDPSAGAAMAQQLIGLGVLRALASILAEVVDELRAHPPHSTRGVQGWHLVASAAELAEEVLFRTTLPTGDTLPVAASSPVRGGAAVAVGTTEPLVPRLLSLLGGVLADPASDTPKGTHAASAGALQHLLTHAHVQEAFTALPAAACAAPLVAAIASAESTVCRRAAGALCNASTGAGLDTVVAAGTAAALAVHIDTLDGASSPTLPVALRTLERLCVASAVAREEAADALPTGRLLTCLADHLSASNAQVRASASRVVGSLSRAESRHWKPALQRRPRRVWPRGSIVYYTGVALEPWGPEKLDTGLGGSETAVLQLTSRWAACNGDGGVGGDDGTNGGVHVSNDGGGEREVAVYLRTSCGARTWRGVQLIETADFNPADSFDTLIVWRSLEVLDEPIDAMRVLLDLHDMPRVHEMSPRRLARVSRLMLKSEFQKGQLPARAAHISCSVVPNGVDEQLVARVLAGYPRATARSGGGDGAADAVQGATASGPKRESSCITAEPAAEAVARPLTLLYTSSYDRGLEHMLRHGWPRILTALPLATLHVYYGWSTHEALYQTSPWREQMRALIASFGTSVVDHGRVGQPELLEAKARAPLLYYITDFPEVDCIAVREAAMLGCVPLTSTFAVFGDVSKDYCVRVPGEPRDPATQHAAADVAIQLLRAYEATGELPNVHTPTLQAETWARVAERWLQDCMDVAVLE